MLTTQNRALYIGAGGTNNAQTQASLPLATGQAHYEIEAEFGFLFPASGSIDIESLVEGEATRPSRDLSPEVLAMQIAAVAGTEMDLKSFNKSLKGAGVRMATEKTKVAARG